MSSVLSVFSGFPVDSCLGLCKSALRRSGDMALPVSAFIICFNEQNSIEGCIRSLKMCEEIVVVDSGSVDSTESIVKFLIDEGFPIRFFVEPWRGFGAQKQFALSKCTKDWCFSIDSDERVSSRLAASLVKMIACTSVSGWRITRYDYLLGYGFVPPASHERFHIRLFRKGTGYFDPSDTVHEGIRVEGEVKAAPHGGLLHYTPISIERQIEKWNKYSSLKAKMKADRNIKPKPIKFLFSPIVFFLRWYIRYGYWRCGWAGFIHCVEAAIYSFLTEAKRWENQAVLRRPPVEPDLSEFDRY